MFSAFLDDEGVNLIGVEPAGHGLNSAKHGAVLSKGKPGCFARNEEHGFCKMTMDR